jgi:hypothetical protein
MLENDANDLAELGEDILTFDVSDDSLERAAVAGAEDLATSTGPTDRHRAADFDAGPGARNIDSAISAARLHVCARTRLDRGRRPRPRRLRAWIGKRLRTRAIADCDGERDGRRDSGGAPAVSHHGASPPAYYPKRKTEPPLVRRPQPTAHLRRGTADRSQHRQAAGASALNANSSRRFIRSPRRRGRTVAMGR